MNCVEQKITGYGARLLKSMSHAHYCSSNDINLSHSHSILDYYLSRRQSSEDFFIVTGLSTMNSWFLKQGFEGRNLYLSNYNSIVRQIKIH